MMRSITIIDVMRSMKVEITPDLSWAIGALVRDLYEQLYGNPPKKELRQKTNDGGTHCFAVYPESMRRDIERVIRSYDVEGARQGRFDF